MNSMRKFTPIRTRYPYLFLSLTIGITLNAQNFYIPIDLKLDSISSGGFMAEAMFEIPAKSDLIIDYSNIHCKGWMPRGAIINEVCILGIEGLKSSHKWKCENFSCCWDGGKQGVIYIWTLTEKDFEKFELTISVSGIGTWYGISKKYECELNISK